MEIKKLTKQPETISAIFVQAVIMQNGEIICLGKTIGWYDGFKEIIYERKSLQN